MRRQAARVPIHRTAVRAMGIAALAVAALPAAAQLPAEGASSEVTFQVGPWLVHPFFQAQLERTGNLFQQTAGRNSRPATVSTALPGLVAELPFSHSRISLGYALRWRDYALEDRASGASEENRLNENPLSHYLRGQAHLVFGNGLVVGLRDDFRTGVLETQIFEGGEVRFSGERWRRNDTEAEVGLDRSPLRRLGVVFGRTDERIDERAGTGDDDAFTSGAFDVRENRARLQGEHQLRPTLWGLWEAGGKDSTLTRPPLAGPSDGPEERRMQESVVARVGFRRLAPGGGQIDGLFGWSSDRFEDDLGVAATPGTLVGNAGWTAPLIGGGTLSLRAARDVFASVDADQYYVGESIRFEGRNSPLDRVRMGGSAGFYRNDYPSADRGRDRTVAGEVWIGYRLARWVEGRLLVGGARRDSSRDGLDYNVRSVTLQFRAGSGD